MFAAAGIALALSLISYHPQDPSWNAVSGEVPLNWTGYLGSHVSDACFQFLGLLALALPVMLAAVAWKWLRSREIEAPWAKMVGLTLFVLSGAALLGFSPGWRIFQGTVPAGGMLGLLLASWLVGWLNLPGAAILTATTLLVSLYLATTFSMALVGGWLSGPLAMLQRMGERWSAWS